MPYLLDAEAIINALAGRPLEVGALRQLAPQGIAIGWLTIGELYEGALGGRDPEGHLRSLRHFLSPFRVLDLNDPVMERFAGIRGHLRQRGELIPDFDILLGAIALHYDLTVLTHNVRHLRRISDLRIYASGA